MPTAPVDVVVHVPLHVPAEHGGALVIQRLRQLHSVTEESGCGWILINITKYETHLPEEAGRVQG